MAQQREKDKNGDKYASSVLERGSQLSIWILTKPKFSKICVIFPSPTS